jgi:Right handed beta helix region
MRKTAWRIKPKTWLRTLFLPGVCSLAAVINICLAPGRVLADKNPAALSANFYVATNGSDAWSGTHPLPDQSKTDGPFASLEAARDAVRKLKRSIHSPKDITVWILGGTYPRESTFELTEEDGGTAASPVTWRAYENQPVRLLGGKIIRSFQPVTDSAILARLPAGPRQHVLQCDLRAQGVTKLGHLSRRGYGGGSHPSHLELFFAGQRMQLARWPNEDYTTIDSAGGDEKGGDLGKLEDGFHYQGDRPRNWQSMEDVWVHGYWAWDWADSYEQIDSIDIRQRLIKTKPPYGVFGFRQGQRFYFLNVLEELDSPGEYFLAHDSGLLYFWPPEPTEKFEASVSVLEPPLIRLRNVTGMTLRGLRLEVTRGCGIDIEGGADDLVAGCALRDIGTYAVVINGGVRHRVVGCDVERTGDGGVVLNGGDRSTLSPGGNVVENCQFQRFGEWSRCYQPAVRVSGVGNRVSHCLIQDGPHNAILLAGNEHLIEFNDISRVCLETGDVGAVYAGRDYSQLGNVIRYNYFHDLHKRPATNPQVYTDVMAVYLDDCMSGVTVFGNIFYRAGRGTLIGGGRENTIENNIYIDCEPAISVDGRGIDPSPVWHNMVYKELKTKLETRHPHAPPYLDKYPQLLELDKYYAKQNGVPPEGNKILRNICVGPWLDFDGNAKPEMVRISDNLTKGDPAFVAPDKHNFQLKPGSPAFKLGFQRIPIEKIGLVGDEYRTAAPGESGP